MVLKILKILSFSIIIQLQVSLSVFAQQQSDTDDSQVIELSFAQTFDILSDQESEDTLNTKWLLAKTALLKLYSSLEQHMPLLIRSTHIESTDLIEFCKNAREYVSVIPYLIDMDSENLETPLDTDSIVIDAQDHADVLFKLKELFKQFDFKDIDFFIEQIEHFSEGHVSEGASVKHLDETVSLIKDFPKSYHAAYLSLSKIKEILKFFKQSGEIAT
jgi:hypothetical protein